MTKDEILDLILGEGRRILPEKKDMTLAAKPAGSQTLEQATARTIQAVEVLHHEGPLMIPNGMTLQSAMDALNARIKALASITTVVEQINAFPWDAALALAHVINEKFGWKPDPSSSMSVDTGFNQTASVPWGTFKVPGLNAEFFSDATVHNNLLVAKYIVKVTGFDAPVVKELFELARKRAREHSIYRGKAFEIVFHSPDGERLVIPEIKFMDVSKVDASKLTFSKAVQDAVETSLFTPIRRIRELAANDIPVKRGVLLHGPFGTGKTLAAAVAAKLAVEQGMTYIYVPNSREAALAIQFSRPYQDPAVLLFVEDIDRPMSGERNARTDEVLNTLDGADSKGDKLMVVFTSNDVESIEPALLRPGRLDAVIEVTPPDAEAAARLVKIYGDKALAADIDLVRCGMALSGMIPAVIAEVLQRAKLAELKTTPRGERVTGIGTAAIVEAAGTMKDQLRLINKTDPVPMEIEEALAVVGDFMNRDSGEIAQQRKGPRAKQVG